MLLSCLWIYFQNQPCKKNNFRNARSVSDTLDLDQVQRFGGADLGLTYLQILSVDDISVKKELNAHLHQNQGD